MRVTKVRVASTRGANKMPSSGDVWFSDGKSYGWVLVSPPFGNEVVFTGQRRKYASYWQDFTFLSKPRERALRAYLGLEG